MSPREPLPLACENCRYFGEMARMAGHQTADWGSCRRYAPRGPVVDTDHTTGIDFFPPTRPDLWCGEYVGIDGFLFVSPRDLPKPDDDEDCPF